MQQLDEERISRIQQGLEGNLQPPFKIDLELHRRCNQDCRMCYRQGEFDPHHLNARSRREEQPPSFWMGLVEEAKDLGVKEWHLAGGGEPFFLPERTLRVMKQVKYGNMRGILTTNGSSFERDQLSQMVDIGWDVVHFSLHGMRDVHNYLTGGNNFDDIITHIKALNRLKKEQGVDKPLVNVNTVLTRNNFEQLGQLPYLLSSLNCNLWFVEPLITYSQPGRDLALSNEDIIRLKDRLPRIRQLCTRNDLDINFRRDENNLAPELIRAARDNTMREVIRRRYRNQGTEETMVPCYQPWTHLSVKLDGRANFCDVYTDPGLNVRDASIEEIWHSSRLNEVRNRMKNGQIPVYCDRCNPSRLTQRERFRRCLKGKSPS